MKIDVKYALRLSVKPIGITVGSFDGVHRGHEFLLSRFKAACDEKGLQAVCVSFNPHPAVYIKNMSNYVIDSSEMKEKNLIDKFGITLVEIDFNRTIQNMKGEEFFQELLTYFPKVKLFYAGHDFSLGKNKEFGFDQAVKCLKNICCIQASKYQESSIAFSSTLVRENLKLGKLYMANYLLGHVFNLSANVVRGSQVGRTIGFPTANLSFSKEQILPGNGVYFCKCFYDDKEYRGLVNVGTRPTVCKSDDVIVEVHILNFNKDIYGKRIKIYFYHKLRNEKKFHSKEDLEKQIQKDKKSCRDLYFYGRFALVGREIKHSKSPSIYSSLTCVNPIDYTLLDIKDKKDIDLKALLKVYPYISITAPYKQFVFNQCDIVDSPLILEAVNAVRLMDGKVIGTNTDYLGVLEILKSYDLKSKHIYILGSGSMSKVLSAALEKFKIKYQRLSRSLGNLSLLVEISGRDCLIINAISRDWTPTLNIDYNGSFWDLNYNTNYEKALLDNKLISYSNGLELLSLQARFALDFWDLKRL